MKRSQFTRTVWKILCLGLLLVGSTTHSVSAQTDSITEILTGSDKSVETAEPSKTIESNSSPAEDSKIRDRLERIYSELDDLAAVDVSVSNSVVSLTGSTTSVKSIERAESLASKVEGVAEVVNSISVSNDVSERVGTTVNRVANTLQSLIVSLPMLVLAFASVAIAWFLGRKLAARTTFFKRITPNAFIAELLGNVCWIVITFVGVFIGLSLLDATSLIGTVLGAAGIFGLAIGFAVRDTVENYIASILLSLRHPFKTRDYVAIGEIEGSVARLTSRATILISVDGNHIRIPNSTVYKSSIVNYTRNPQRRFQFTVGVDTEVELGGAQQIAINAIADVPGVLLDPEASIVVDELGDSNVSLVIRGWVDQRTHDISKVRSESIRFIKKAFDDAGIVMPEPIYRVVMSGSLHGATETGMATAKSTDNNGKASATHATFEAQDTSADTSVDATLEAEIICENDENLLTESAQQE